MAQKICHYQSSKKQIAIISFFPATDFELAIGPELEVYLPGDPSKDDYQCEVWIPLKNKS